MILDAVTALRNLITADPLCLGVLPREHGIYALHDHTGAIRYIGITKADKLGFYGRINNRHASGSESRSHKFSQAYNMGRMWRARGDTRSDARLAKSLRTAFVRRYCRATFVTVPLLHQGDLASLEIGVQTIAPTGMLDWGSKRDFVPLSEPRELVDDLLDELRFSSDQRVAVERQAFLHASLGRKST